MFLNQFDCIIQDSIAGVKLRDFICVAKRLNIVSRRKKTPIRFRRTCKKLMKSNVKSKTLSYARRLLFLREKIPLTPLQCSSFRYQNYQFKSGLSLQTCRIV